MADAAPPDALLLIAPGCPHCPALLDALTAALKAGRLARLEIVNIAAGSLPPGLEAVRSVPWVRIGPFELHGAQTQAALTDWIERARRGDGLDAYALHLLESGRLERAAALGRDHPELLAPLLARLEQPELPIVVRIGISALLEELAGSPALTAAVPALLRLADAPVPNLRADAAHLLGLCNTATARARLRRLAEDPQPEVREIAREALAPAT